MFKRILRSLIKKILPLVFKILLKFKLNRRVINFLNEKSYFSNNNYDFSSIIKSIIKDEKIIAFDIPIVRLLLTSEFFLSFPILVPPI